MGAVAGTLLGLTIGVGSAKADPGPATPQTGDPAAGIVLILIDRSGSMHDGGKNCIDENGLPITASIRKWECAINAAKFNVKNADATGVKRYFIWAFGTMVYDPTYLPIAWSIDKTGQPIKDGSGNVVQAAITDLLAMNRTDALAALTAMAAGGPTTNDCGTPLAGAYCLGVQGLDAYRGSYTDFELRVVLESDGYENSTPSTTVCQGVDSTLQAGFTYAQGNPAVVEVVSSGGYVTSADGLYVPSWQSNMLDVSVTGVSHAPDPTGKVLTTSGAFTPPPGIANLLANINFIKEFVGSTVLALAPSPAAPGVDTYRPARASTLPSMSAAAVASATTDPDMAFLKGLAEVTGGRLVAFGDGTVPVPGDITAPHAVPGDVDDNGCVDGADFGVLKQYMNQKIAPSNPTSYAADLNQDARIDVNDYYLLEANWGRGCATPPPPVPVPSTSILGFDDLGSWSSGQATLAQVSLPRTEGLFSLSVGNTGFRTLKSVNFSTTVLSGVTSKLALDVALPKTVSNPYWVGQVLFFANCPSAGVYNQYLGAAELAGLPLGKFSTVRVGIPQAVKNAMTTAHSDFSFSISLNANDPGYLIDNLRFVP